MGNISSRKSNTESGIQSIHKAKLTTIERQTTFEDIDDVDDYPAQVASPIQMPQTPLTESIAYHLTRLRSANKLNDHSGMQTPSILLRRRIAKDLCHSKPPARDLNPPMDPRSPVVIIPRTPIILNGRGKQNSLSMAKSVRTVNRRLNIDDESGRENRITLRKIRSVADMKTIKPTSENEVTSTVDDIPPKQCNDITNENSQKKDVPDCGGRRVKTRNVYTTPKIANVRPMVDTGRTPLSVISQPDEQTPIRTRYTPLRARSVSRIPIYKR